MRFGSTAWRRPFHPPDAHSPFGGIEAPARELERDRGIFAGFGQFPLVKPAGQGQHVLERSLVPARRQGVPQHIDIGPIARRFRQQFQYSQPPIFFDGPAQAFPGRFRFPFGVSAFCHSDCPRRDAGRLLQQPPGNSAIVAREAAA